MGSEDGVSLGIDVMRNCWPSSEKSYISLYKAPPNVAVPGIRTVVASLTIDFHYEMKAGNPVLTQGNFTRVGEKSFSYDMRMYETDSMTHCATQKTVEVCFDTQKRASAQFPADIREKLVRMIGTSPA
jgi:acyl-CoA thioesterase FadM